MNPYAIVGSESGSAASLRARLMGWHDAMVAHERRLRSRRTTDVCDDECPHAEARTLWEEALAMLGPRARELTFLQSGALAASASSGQRSVDVTTVAKDADTVHRSSAIRTAAPQRLSKSRIDSADRVRVAAEPAA